MEIIRGLYNLRPRHRGCVATIGNFDGVHLGHQAVLGQLAERAGELDLPTVVVTFEPQPREFFTHGDTPPRLTRFREKMQALRRFSVDRIVCLRFDAALAAMPAAAFIERERVSSTRIRAARAAGDLGGAEKLLGRPYRMCGRVAHGDERGRQLGFPTANIHLYRKSSPLRGVYAVEVFGLEHEPLSGVANVGTRPTVGGVRSQLEVHLLDFSGDIYGRYLHVDFLHKLRDEQRFDSLAALTAQIAQDAAAARAFHAKRR